VSPQGRDADGRFTGAERVNGEHVPALRATIGKTVLADQQRRQFFAVWLTPAEPDIVAYMAILEATAEPETVRVEALGRPAVLAKLSRLHRLQGPIVFWICPRCARRTATLYLFGHGEDGRPQLVTGCSRCLGLHYESRGAPLTRRRLMRVLLGINPVKRLPYRPGLLGPDVLTHDITIVQRFKNLSVEPPGSGPGPTLELTFTV